MTRLFRVFTFVFAAAICAAQPNAATISTLSLSNYTAPSYAFDPSGGVYLATRATGGATPGAAQTQPGGGTCVVGGGGIGPPLLGPCSDAFIVKLDRSGNIVFATLLGGPESDRATAAAIDSAGNIYVTGMTGGSFPTTPGSAIPSSTNSTAFAAKLSADGSKFLYVTYLPSTFAGAEAIAVDAQGNAYVAGSSSNNATVVKVSADGSAIVFQETLGVGKLARPGLGFSSGSDAQAIAVDGAGDVFVGGNTSNPKFPATAGAVQLELAGPQNAFVAEFDPDGNLLMCTYLGGSGTDQATSVAVDGAGNIYLAGNAYSLDFPATSASFQPAPLIPAWNEIPGGFAAKLSPGATKLLYSTYVPTGIFSSAITPGPSGDSYVTGGTGALFPVTASAPQPCFGGIQDMFVAHLDPSGALLDATYAGPGDGYAAQIAVEADGSILAATGLTVSRLAFGSSGWTAPACVSPGVLNSATLLATTQPLINQPLVIAPGELVTLTGFGIGPAIAAGFTPDATQSAPTSLAGVQVLFDGAAAPMFYAQSQQVNAQAPFELAGKSTTSVTLEYNGSTFGPLTLSVMPANPGLFRLQPGVSAQAYAVNQDGTINGPSNPAPIGSVVALWGTGFGPTAPGCADGGLNIDAPADLSGASVIFNIGQSEFPSVTYAGSAPTLACGITQVNIQIPANARAGAFPVNPSAIVLPAGTIQGTVPGTVIYVQ